jgi:hypothetical protein
MIEIKNRLYFDEDRESHLMQTLEAKVLSILQLQPYRKGDSPDGQSKGSGTKYWQLRVSYVGSEALYEIELREPLLGFAAKKCTIGLNGLVEFEMVSEPNVAAGDRILIDAYEPGEKLLR